MEMTWLSGFRCFDLTQPLPNPGPPTKPSLRAFAVTQVHREASSARTSVSAAAGQAGQKSSSDKPSSDHLTPASSGVSQLNSYISAPPLSE